MILSAEYSHGQDKMGTTSMMPTSVLHSSRHSLYTGYLMEPWHHPLPMKQEPEEANNDSGIYPNNYNSDGSLQNTSPRSEDSGHAGDSQTNATLGVLARPIMEAPGSPSVSGPMGESPRGLSPRISPQSSPQLRLSPQQPSPQQRLSPQHPLGFQSPQRFSPQQSASFSTPVAAHSPSAPQPPKDESSRSPVSSDDLYYEDPLRGLQMALQRRGMIGPVAEQPVNGEKPLQCPLCQFSTTIRSAFNNHLMSEHSEQASCHLCDHTAENHGKLREHLQMEHDLQLGPEDELGAWGEDDEPGVTTPKVNSQGKVKTYRCKQCEFSTVTKLEFWEHTRGHIKPERLLTCPKCPFVTEYKHHLEYHLRNHFGSKPFKCDKCSYSCVNKSMLNSHLKSHSNVYQFRCADCAYATKYCHSLKLHLRKYNHSPAMVLNPDGSPNPLPIVDVYGTRRGPKRPKKPEDLPSPQQSSLPSLHPMFSNPYGFLPSQAIPYPYNTIMNTFHRNPLLTFPNNNPIVQENTAPPKSEQDKSFFNATINTIQQSAMNNNQEGVKEYLTRVITTQQEIIARTENTQEEPSKACPGAPLDLSRPEPEQQEPLLESSGDQSLADPLTTTKNRRKGKAFKLERIAQRLQQQSSDEEDGERSPKRHRFDHSPEHIQDKTEESVQENSCIEGDKATTNVNFCEPVNGEFRSTISEERKERWRNVKEVYDCAYCDMLFGDVVMYTMHMGYHGYQNPYTCNMCGHQTTDKVQFFLHLFRFAHG
ncbi:protein hunchback-like [Macrosteles quadrilineatus]|uniref:protein hunchback-like n=1 Tax=Macrosteles quadrilineatus TaxID=74068 RepID=UPI0023E158C0|nr:protein hunchback-like [Macrosteles quadrilineatus]